MPLFSTTVSTNPQILTPHILDVLNNFCCDLFAWLATVPMMVYALAVQSYMLWKYFLSLHIYIQQCLEKCNIKIHVKKSLIWQNSKNWRNMEKINKLCTDFRSAWGFTLHPHKSLDRKQLSLSVEGWRPVNKF